MDKRLAELSWGAPLNFLGLPEGDAPSLEHAGVVMLPVPYEATVSYMGGTRFGPRRILEASRAIELYDHELDTEPYRVGVHTLPELLLTGAGPEAALAELRTAFDALLADGRFVLMLGGEHSISAPPIKAHAARLGSRRLSVLQLDAHGDLRAEYEGTPFSHACVMYRVHEAVTLVPVGIRAITAEERRLIREKEIPTIFAHELDPEERWIERALDALGPDVYITIDIDYFDPGLVPSTGTPEPGGGTWYPTLRLLERVFAERNVVGADLVELAPLPGIVAPDFLAAKLAYKLVAYHQRARDAAPPRRR
ncbi:MAG TPA: agmatinase [Gemmatimonadales bacterium]|nr:agmatinase [Gemmatimonadales bacterium]